MHILFIGYGKTSQRVAKHLFERGHHISTISRTPKTDCYATHYTQDVHCLDVTDLAPIDVVYVILAPSQSGLDAYQHTYVDSIKPIVQALASHPVKRIVIVSSTRVYGQNAGSELMMILKSNQLMSKDTYYGRWNYFGSPIIHCRVLLLDRRGSMASRLHD